LKEPEKNIINGCLKGDSNSQKALYERFKVPMFRICLRYAKDRAEAEDMLQDGFIKVFADLHQYKGTGALGGWIRRVMVNVALQQIRKKKNLFSSIEIEQVANNYDTGEDIYATLGAQALIKMVQQLPPGYRTVFNLFVIEGYSHQEIGEQLGISSNTSKSQLSKAKASLRKMLEKVMIN